MFSDLLADYSTWSPAALDTELRQLELQARELDARRLAVRAAAETAQTFAIDGHTSVKAYLRATTNQPSPVVLAETRRARLCRDFPAVGEALISGRIGLGQIDELVRITRNPRAVTFLDEAQVDMLVGHAEHLSIRNFALAVDHWLMWADPDGAWRDQTEAIERRQPLGVGRDLRGRTAVDAHLPALRQGRAGDEIDERLGGAGVEAGEDDALGRGDGQVGDLQRLRSAVTARDVDDVDEWLAHAERRRRESFVRRR